MGEKTNSSEKTSTQLDVSPTPKQCGDKEDIKATSGKPHQHAKVRSTAKLPCLKLADLVTQVTTENAHREVSTGPAVGNEVW